MKADRSLAIHASVEKVQRSEIREGKDSDGQDDQQVSLHSNDVSLVGTGYLHVSTFGGRDRDLSVIP